MKYISERQRRKLIARYNKLCSILGTGTPIVEQVVYYCAFTDDIYIENEMGWGCVACVEIGAL